MYQRAEPGSIDQEVFRNAIIKGFELTQEISIKLIKRALRDFDYTSRTLEITPIKELLRMAGIHDLMTLEEVERWFRYRDNRNSTAYDYGEKFAVETLSLLPDFLIDARTLEAALRVKFENTD
jgi:nucleotidyltransferase substrate binding protein (TIGR01987 family)